MLSQRGWKERNNWPFCVRKDVMRVQGYLLSHPMSAEKLTEQLRRSSFNNFSSAADFTQLPQVFKLRSAMKDRHNLTN